MIIKPISDHHELIWGTEDWIISGHKNGKNVLKGMDTTLEEFYASNKEFFGNCPSETFPLLVKIIDAKKDLSVQVHPNDSYAKEKENSLGKTECWYILDAEEGADIIVGQTAKDKEEMKAAIENEQIMDMLELKSVKKGDFFYIPSGAVHAIRSNTKILEIQQSSDITYRLYDYNRPGVDGKPRELHVEKSLDVIDYNFKVDTDLITTKDNVTTFVDNEFFKVEKIEVKGSYEVAADKYFTMGICFADFKINGEEFKDGETFIASSNEKITVEGNGTLFISTYGG